MTPNPQSNPTQVKIDLREHVGKLLESHVDDDANFEKLLQFLRLRKADYYYRGIQYIAPDLSPTGVIDYMPLGSPVVGGETQRGLLDYNIDQVRTFGRKFIATLGQRPFYNLKAVADDPESESDRIAAREADKGYDLLRAQWNCRIMNLEMAYHAWKSGTIFPYTRYVVDGNKYGYSEEPVWGHEPMVTEPGGFKCFQCGTKSPELNVVPVPDENGGMTSFTACPTCNQALDQTAYEQPVEIPVPVQQGTKQYPNGRVELHFLTGFFITVPFYSPNFQNVPFLEYRCEEHIGRLVALYPKLREKMKDGDLNIGSDAGAVQNSGVISRASAESQVGLPRQNSAKHRTSYIRTWVRPFMYEMVPDDAARTQLKEQFPNGLKVVRVGKEVVDLADEKMDDYFTAVYPEVGEYIFRDGISWGILQHQDAINDTFNQLAEIVERTNTVNLIWANVIDVDSLNQRPNSPMEFLPVPPNTDLDRCTRELKSPTFPKEATQLITILQENIKTNTGVLDNVFGAAITGDTTAEANRNQLNQALMQLGTTGEFMAEGWRQIFTNGVNELARNAPRNVKALNGELIDIEALNIGKWHFEAELGIPRSYAERKDELKKLLMLNPDMAAATIKTLGVDAPANTGAMRDYLDLPDLQDPADDERQFVNELINELIQGQPIPPQPQQDPSMPPSAPMPSSTRLLDLVDAQVLDAANTAELIREWVVGAGRKLIDTPGFQNVMAVMQQLKQRMMPPPMPDGGAPPAQQGGAPPAPGPDQPNPRKTPPKGDKPLPTGAGGSMAQPAA